MCNNWQEFEYRKTFKVVKPSILIVEFPALPYMNLAVSV